MYDDCVHVHSVHNHTRMHVGMHTSLCKRVIDHDVAHVRACHVNVKRNEVNAAAGGHDLAVVHGVVADAVVVIVSVLVAELVVLLPLPPPVLDLGVVDAALLRLLAFGASVISKPAIPLAWAASSCDRDASVLNTE